MVERNINVKSVNLISTKQVMPSKAVTLSASDALNAYEFILFAAESMQGVIDWEVRTGRERPIVESMREYVRDARSLLKRLNAARE